MTPNKERCTRRHAPSNPNIIDTRTNEDDENETTKTNYSKIKK